MPIRFALLPLCLAAMIALGAAGVVPLAAGGAPRLRFGVYPWAGPGAIAAVDSQLADRPYADLTAVRALAGARSFTVRLYGEYTGLGPGDAAGLLSDARWWSDHGVKVEIVLRYRPARADLERGYGAWVAAVAARLAAIANLSAIQVGNEANNTASPAAGDGAYPGAVAAIATGAPAARAAVLAARRPDIRIGFNWAAGAKPCQDDPFFAALARAGGRAFVDAVAWVGLDLYPGTWSPPARAVDPDPSPIGKSVIDGLECLRQRQMPSAGLSSAVAITVAETGYPTDATRSEQSQASVLSATVRAVHSVSDGLGVTDLRWFDLRDANTRSGQLENGYGLLRDDYSRKPAFAVLQRLIAAAHP